MTSADRQQLLLLAPTSWVGCHADENQGVLLGPMLSPVTPIDPILSSGAPTFHPGTQAVLMVPPHPHRCQSFPASFASHSPSLPDCPSADFRPGTRWRTLASHLLLKPSVKLYGSGTCNKSSTLDQAQWFYFDEIPAAQTSQGLDRGRGIN